MKIPLIVALNVYYYLLYYIYFTSYAMIYLQGTRPWAWSCEYELKPIGHRHDILGWPVVFNIYNIYHSVNFQECRCTAYVSCIYYIFLFKHNKKAYNVCILVFCIIIIYIIRLCILCTTLLYLVLFSPPFHHFLCYCYDILLHEIFIVHLNVLQPIVPDILHLVLWC